jgi:hypothetical protein
MTSIFSIGIPDFARLYPPCPVHGYDGEGPEELKDTASAGCDACLEAALLSPRRAYALWAAASHYLTALRAALANEAEPLVDAVAEQVELPPIVLRYLQPAWVARFSVAFDAFREMLATGEGLTAPECTGESMALQLMIAWGQVFVAQGFWRTSEVYRSLPMSWRDEDFELLEQLLVDEDVLLLFDERLADCDDPDRLLASFGVRNLNPARWFLPFEEQADAA